MKPDAAWWSVRNGARCSVLALVVTACGGESSLSVGRTRDFGDARLSMDGNLEPRDAAASYEARSDVSVPTCGDTASDPANCGRCGHDCQGGACVGGVCQPAEVAIATACTIAIDARNVYWVAGDSDAQTLMALPVDGGAARSLASTPHEVTDIAVDADNLYFSRSVAAGGGVNGYEGSVAKVPLGGGAPVTLASGTYRPSAIAVRGPNVYFTTLWQSTFDPADQVPTGSVMKAPAEPGATSTLVTGLEDAVDIATDAQNVYSVHSFGAGCMWGCVVGIPLGGGAPATVVSNATTTQVSIRAAALDGTDVYWIDEGIQGAVEKQSLAGGARVALASDQYEPRAIAVDEANVYWSTFTPGDVVKVPRSGGASTVVAEDQCNACAIAANASSIFWVSCGSLMRLAK